jgi:carnitine-CoA ligase
MNLATSAAGGSALTTAHVSAASTVGAGRVEVADTIPALLFDAAERDPGGVWLRTDEGSATFGDAAGHVIVIAERLFDTGVRRGDLVVVTTRTTAPYLLCWLALATLGAICVPTDPSAKPAELAGLLGQVKTRWLVSDEEAADLVAQAGAAAQAELGVLDVTALVGDWRAPASEVARPRSNVGTDDVVVLIPTSGTTGRSKLVMQTQRAYAMAGEGFPFWMELSDSDRLMTSLPLFHINAPAYSALGSLACGAGLVLLPRFSASGFLDAARRHGATEFNAIGAMLEILARQPERLDDADNPLRLCYTGPSPTREWQETFERRFGLRIVCGYALSESPYGLIWRHGTRPFATLGSIRQHPTLGQVNEGRVIDDEGREVGPGSTGELLLRNPAVTPGYWQMPDATAETIVDGWLHTGDLVTVNADDTYTFVARKKEVLRRRGLNLSPTEVEDAIATHPDVLEVAVVGVPSELTEDEVKAFVVARPGHRLDFAQLHAFAARQISAFKVPRYWQAVAALPRTPTARVAKHQLPTGHPPGEYDIETAAPLAQPEDAP